MPKKQSPNAISCLNKYSAIAGHGLGTPNFRSRTTMFGSRAHHWAGRSNGQSKGGEKAARAGGGGGGGCSFTYLDRGARVLPRPDEEGAVDDGVAVVDGERVPADDAEGAAHAS